MSWWSQKAWSMQQDVIAGETDSRTELGEENAQRAVIHTRQDLVVVISLLNSLNRQAAWIVNILIVLLVVVLAVAIKIYG